MRQVSAGRGLLRAPGGVGTKGWVISEPLGGTTLLTLDLGLPASLQRGSVFSEPQAVGEALLAAPASETRPSRPACSPRSAPCWEGRLPSTI